MSFPTTTTTPWIQPVSNPPHNPTASPTEDDLEFRFHIWLHDAAVWFAPLLDGRQFKDDWRVIADELLKSPIKEDGDHLKALNCFLAAANKEFKWCPASALPHANPNACFMCCNDTVSPTHACRMIGRIEERSAKLWYSSPQKQENRVKKMPSDRSIFWSSLDRFLRPRGEQVESPRIRLLQAHQLRVEKKMIEQGDEIERLENVSEEQVEEISRLKVNLTTQAAAAAVAAAVAAERLKKDLNEQAETMADEIKRLKDELMEKGEALKS